MPPGSRPHRRGDGTSRAQSCAGARNGAGGAIGRRANYLEPCCRDASKRARLWGICGPAMNIRTKLRVAVLDMQPIEPATGGGRLRLLGLYHALGENIETRYVGTYDWPGPEYRRRMLSPTLEELLVPLSAEHFAAAQARRDETGGRVVIDSTFPELAHLSPDYVNAARAAAGEAD